jgi:hypothetical protein
MFALAGGMLDGEDDNFLRLFVSRVIDQIWISPRHQFAHALDRLSALRQGFAGEPR